MITKTKITVAAALIAAIASPVLTASAASAAHKHRAYDAGAYASTDQVLQPGSLTEQRWFDRAASPRND
jgi:hypothetical protein